MADGVDAKRVNTLEVTARDSKGRPVAEATVMEGEPHAVLIFDLIETTNDPDAFRNLSQWAALVADEMERTRSEADGGEG